MPIFKRLLTAATLATVVVLIACGNSKSPQPTTAATPATSVSLSIEGGAKSPFARALNANLKNLKIEHTVTAVMPTPIANLYWVGFNNMPGAYVTSDAKHIVQSDILTLDGAQIDNLKSRFLSTQIRDQLAKEPIKDMIVFPAKGTTKDIIYVFTDADCGYCRKFHQGINAINNQGIEVRYLAWPRAPEFEAIMESIWCSNDRPQALSMAKAGTPVSSKQCVNPVKHQQELGMLFGVNGTPAIFTSGGIKIGGYLSPEQLLQALNQ